MTFDQASLRDLLLDQDQPKVSLLMPAHRAGTETTQDPIRFEGLLRIATSEMPQIGVTRADARAIETAARELTSSGGFWRNQGDGLALFATPERLRWFAVPVDLEELVVVGAEFQVVPIVPIASQPHFYILAVSRGGVRFFAATRHAISELDLPDAPEDIREIDRFYDPEAQLQFRQASTAGRGSQVALFHGHGLGEGRDREVVLQYLRAIDRSIRRTVGPELAPLLVAGANGLPALFRQVSTYTGLLDQTLDINPDGLRPEELLRRTAPSITHLVRQPIEAALARYQGLAGTGKASDLIPEVVVAAWQGRVDTIVVRDRSHAWGTLDVEGSKVEAHDVRLGGDVDLVNVAAMHTLRNGGSVEVATDADWPGTQSLAAVYRY